jgi:hypothetical protein
VNEVLEGSLNRSFVGLIDEVDKCAPRTFTYLCLNFLAP